MIVVYMDITAPIYFYKQLDAYKVGTVRNSCSTMHTITNKEFTLDDFSCENLIGDEPIPTTTFSTRNMLKSIIGSLNILREMYAETQNKKYWHEIIQILPSSYNQKSTFMLNYEVLASIYHSRKNHKLTEWQTFCEWIENLPYSELITGEIG
jgi:hypothetical protein